MGPRNCAEPVLPTLEQLGEARVRFEAYEPRDLFYRAATELVALALQGATKLSVGEALAVLLETWNAQYYRFHPFDSEHFDAIDKVVASHRLVLDAYRSRAIVSMTVEEFDAIAELFSAFKLVLGPVGAAKALNLLAPDFFPLWDRAITKGYGIYLGSRGQNAFKYVRFMTTVVSQVCSVCPPGDPRGMLKCIDEFNYCRFTKKWL